MVVDRGISHTREGLLISKFRPKIIYLLRNRKAGKDRAASLGEQSLNNPRKYRLLHLSHSVHFVGPTLYSIRHFGNLFAHRLHEWSYKIKIDNILFAPFLGNHNVCSHMQARSYKMKIYTLFYLRCYGEELQCLLSHAWSHKIQSILLIPFQGSHTCMMAEDTKHFIYPLLEKS